MKTIDPTKLAVYVTSGLKTFNNADTEISITDVTHYDNTVEIESEVDSIDGLSPSVVRYCTEDEVASLITEYLVDYPNEGEGVPKEVLTNVLTSFFENRRVLVESGATGLFSEVRPNWCVSMILEDCRQAMEGDNPF